MLIQKSLQVQLAQSEYQLPRLTRMWSHLERQAGGKSRGMGEKQIEVDKRLLRGQISTLRRSLEDVRRHRSSHRERRKEVRHASILGSIKAAKAHINAQVHH